MSKRITMGLLDGNTQCLRKFKTRLPDHGPIPNDRVKEVALGLFSELQVMTLDDCERWVWGLKKVQEACAKDVSDDKKEDVEHGEGTPASR
jgi:hypothetical protein